MDLKAEKEYIKAELDKVEDIHLVEAIKNLLAYGRYKKYEQGLHPMSKDTFYQRNNLSRKDIENSDLINQEDARSYFKKKHA